MLCMLIAYDAAGNVVATLDHVVVRDADGEVTGLVDFAAHEGADGKLRDIWNAGSAVGSATWPEWIGGRAHDFRVELDGKRIKALVHKDSGHRRERSAIEAAIKARRPREEVDVQIGGLKKQLAYFIVQLEQKLTKEPDMAVVMVNPEKLKIACDQLEALLSEDNAEAFDVLDANAELRNAAFPNHYRQIDNCIQSFDFEAALIALK